jgi:hypothetical protein
MVRQKTLRYGTMGRALKAFGYQHDVRANHDVYRHSKGLQSIVLPRARPNQVVTALHQKIVETALRDDAIVSVPEFQFYLEHGKMPDDMIRKGDRLIWTIPGALREIPVIAAAAEEGGLVIIRQNGTYSPCPVDQLRKIP